MAVETELYDILEVSSTCSETELKKSYRRLCLIHHPDKQASSDSSTPADATKFQSIQAAYEVLSDPEARANYDRFGKSNGRGGGGGGGPDDDFMDDIFASMFAGAGGSYDTRGGGRGRPQPKRPTRTSVVNYPVTLEELFMGKEKNVEVERQRTCATCKGSGAKPKTKPRPCNKCQGSGSIFVLRRLGPVAQRVQVPCPDCDGSGSKIRPQDACKKCHGTRTTKEKKRLEFFIARGSLPGSKVVLTSQGDESPDSSSPGDLQILLSLTPHPTFTLDPPGTLHTTLSLAFSESLLGFSRLILVHLDGRGLRVSHPAPGEKGWRMLKSGDQVVIEGEGWWKGGARGDLVCRIEVEMPGEGWAAGMSRDQVEQLEKLLPPKRADVENPPETDQVELASYTPTPENESSNKRATEEDSDDDDERRGPQCAHQ